MWNYSEFLKFFHCVALYLEWCISSLLFILRDCKYVGLFMARSWDIFGTMNYSRRILIETDEKHINYQGMHQKKSQEQWQVKRNQQKSISKMVENDTIVNIIMELRGKNWVFEKNMMNRFSSLVLNNRLSLSRFMF